MKVTTEINEYGNPYIVIHDDTAHTWKHDLHATFWTAAVSTLPDDIPQDDVRLHQRPAVMVKGLLHALDQRQWEILRGIDM